MPGHDHAQGESRTTEPDRFAELREAREKFRAQKARVAARQRAEAAELERREGRIQKLRDAARAERLKARAVYKRYLKRMKSRWQAERLTIEREREQIRRDQQQRAASAERTASERERIQNELAVDRKRLTEAWQSMAEQQQRLHSDRDRAENWVRQKEDELSRRERDVQRRQNQQDERSGTLEARASSLMAEIASLEARALHTRAVLNQLEDQRRQAELLPGSTGAMPIDQIVVSLESPRVYPGLSQEAEAMLGGIQEAHRTAQRERSKLAVLRGDIERREADLADQRAILAEQVATLAAARELWRSGECGTVAELEALVRALQDRERAADDRERELRDSEGRLRQREFELWHWQQQLDGWQAVMAQSEGAAALDRETEDRLEAIHRDSLERWSATMDGIRRGWAVLREREQELMLRERDGWIEAVRDYRDAATAAHAARHTFTDAAAKFAPDSVAIAQLKQASPRRFAAVKKRWEKHFAAIRRDVERMQSSLVERERQLAERERSLAESIEVAVERRTSTIEARLDADWGSISEIFDREREARLLSFEDARREQHDRERLALKAQVEHLKQRLLSLAPSGTEAESLVTLDFVPRAA